MQFQFSVRITVTYVNTFFFFRWRSKNSSDYLFDQFEGVWKKSLQILISRVISTLNMKTLEKKFSNNE